MSQVKSRRLEEGRRRDEVREREREKAMPLLQNLPIRL